MPEDCHKPRASANQVGRDYFHRANEDGHTPAFPVNNVRSYLRWDALEAGSESHRSENRRTNPAS